MLAKGPLNPTQFFAKFFKSTVRSKNHLFSLAGAFAPAREITGLGSQLPVHLSSPRFSRNGVMLRDTTRIGLTKIVAL